LKFKSFNQENIKKPDNVILTNTNSNNSNNNNEVEEDEKNDIVHVVRLRRLEGDVIEYRKVKKYIFETCAEVLTGLPPWAVQLQEQKQEVIDTQDDDYDLVLKNEENVIDNSSDQ